LCEKIDVSTVKLEDGDESLPPECIVKIEEETVLSPQGFTDSLKIVTSKKNIERTPRKKHTDFEQSPSNALEHKEIIKETVACKICKKKFKEQCMLNRHIVRHLLFICGFCYQEFNKKSVLKRHIFEKHVQSTANIKCLYPDCDKVFKDKSYMLAHTFNHHDNRHCSICNKLYSSWGLFFFYYNFSNLL
jgi:hypothetical protein